MNHQMMNGDTDLFCINYVDISSWLMCDFLKTGWISSSKDNLFKLSTGDITLRFLIHFLAYKLTLSGLNLPLSSSSTTSRELLKMIWSGWKSKENCHVFLRQFHGNFPSKTLSCRKINCVFRNVKWCLHASWGLKGLRLQHSATISTHN